MQYTFGAAVLRALTTEFDLLLLSRRLEMLEMADQLHSVSSQFRGQKLDAGDAQLLTQAAPVLASFPPLARQRAIR